MEKLFERRAGRILVLGATLVMIVVNLLATMPILNGKTTKEISDAYPNLFTPVGMTFSIWGLIYLGLLIFTVLQLSWAEKRLDATGKPLMARLRLFYTLSCLANATWLLLWQYNQIAFSVALMIGLLLSLIASMLTIEKMKADRGLTLLLKGCFGLYLGWITVATIANIAVFLVSIGFQGGPFAPEWWMIATLAVAAIIGSSTIVSFRNPVYGLVLIWGFWGVLQQHLPGGTFDGAYTAIIVSLIACMVLFFVDSVVVSVLAIKKGDQEREAQQKE